ncbi:MAG: hypothetical protein ACC707_17450, partial [Thiohalomonadales bacterium]
TQDTDSAGMAIFNNISGAFTITGQHDFVKSSGTERIAVSIHNIDPPNGQVGLPIFAGVDFLPGIQEPGIRIEGTLKNLPVIPAGYQLNIEARPIDDGCCFGSSFILNGTGVAPADQPYSISNSLAVNDYSVVANIQKMTGNNSGFEYLAAAVYNAKVTTTSTATTAMIDIDFNDPTMLIKFETKTITVANFSQGLENNNISMNSWVHNLPSGIDLYFNAHYQFVNGGFGVVLPTTGSFISSFPAGSVAGYNLSVRRDSANYQISTYDDVTLPFSSTPSLTFTLFSDIFDAPVISSPKDQQTFTATTAASMEVNWTLGTSTTDLVFVSVDTTRDSTAIPPISTGITGINTISWFHIMPGNSINMNMPATAPSMPMFGADSQYDLDVSGDRVSKKFDFNYLFNFDFISNVGGVFDGPGASQGGNHTLNFTTSAAQ